MPKCGEVSLLLFGSQRSPSCAHSDDRRHTVAKYWNHGMRYLAPGTKAHASVIKKIVVDLLNITDPEGMMLATPEVEKMVEDTLAAKRKTQKDSVRQMLREKCEKLTCSHLVCWQT